MILEVLFLFFDYVCMWRVGCPWEPETSELELKLQVGTELWSSAKAMHFQPLSLSAACKVLFLDKQNIYVRDIILCFREKATEVQKYKMRLQGF